MDSPTETGQEISYDSFEETPTDNKASPCSSPVTPDSERIPVALDFGGGSSDITPNHDDSDSSYSEFDSDAEAFYSSLNHGLVSSGTTDEKQMSYGELMKRFLQCEEELKTTNLKLQASQQESADLENLRAGLETANREIVNKDIEINAEKRRSFELQKQVVDLESKLSDLTFNVGNVVDELEASRGRLYESDAEISKLKEMFCECQQNFSIEKTSLEANVADLLDKQALLEARVKELESRGEVLEGEVKRYDVERMEMKSKEVNLKDEINALKKDLASRVEHIEALNKDFDKHKLCYDMLMADKDGVCAEVDNLKAELRSKDIQLKQIEDEMNRLGFESWTEKNTVEELRGVVRELEKQVELQRNVIAEGEEEKREAIRQLCFTVDHYKSGYRQLLRSLPVRNKQQQQQAIVV